MRTSALEQGLLLALLGTALLTTPLTATAAEPLELPRSPLLEREAVRKKPYDVTASIRYTNFEIMLELSPLGWAIGENDNHYSGLARIGPGFWSRFDRFFIGGFLTWQASSVSHDTFGAQLVLFNRDGPGGHVGAFLDTSARPGFMAAFTFYAAGLELQRREVDDLGVTYVVYLKLLIPLFHMYDEFTYLRRTD